MTKPAPSAAWVLICLLCLALVLSPTAPALAVQFPSEVTYDSNGSDANDNILADTGTTFTVEYGVTYTLSGVLSGTGDLIQTDYGTLVLSGVNTYTGNTIVEDHGTLSVSRDENLGEASGKLLLRLAGGLQTTATFSSDRRVEWTDGGGAITTAAGTTLTLNGQLSGDGYLVKKGDGTLVLTNTTNYYRDNVHVTAGVLRAGAAGALCTADYSVFGTLDLNNFNLTIGRLDGAATGQVNLGSATLTIDLPDTADYIGEFTGSGTLIKKGTYTQGFGGDSSSFTGKLILEEGGLRLDATTKFGGTFTQKSGTVLTTSASGTTLGAATFKGTVSPKGTLNVASASFDGATVDLSSNLNTNKIVASGAIAFNGAGTTIKLGDLSAATPGSYLLMTGSGISGLDKVTADVTLGAAQRGAFSLSESDTKLNYGLVTGPQTLTWDGTATAYAWNNSSTNVNWSSGTFNINFKDGDAVIFDSSAANKNVVVDSAGVTVSTMDVNDDYNFSGGKITASGAVTVADGKSLGLVAGSAEALNAASVNFNTSGKLNITGYVPDESSPYASASKNTLTVISTSGGVSGFAPANVTVAGQTSVDFLTARAWQDGNDIKVDTSLSWYLGDSRAHGTFTIAEGESFTLSAALTDEAGNVNWNGQTLTKKGGGTLVLTGANTYTGKTTISAGTLTLSGAGTLGNGNYAGAIENNGALVLDQTSAQTLSGVVSGAGNINKSGNGVLTLSGNSSGYTGTFTQAAGTVHVTNNLGGTFIQNAGTLTSTSGTTLGAATFKGTVTPTGTLNVASASFDGATVNLGNGGVNTVTATGAISFISNVTTISIGDLSGSGTAVLTLVSSTGGAISGLDMVDAQATLGDRRGGLYLADGDTKLFFGIITGSTALTWAGSSSAHNWNTTDNNTNWTTGNFNTYFKTGDDVTFADDGAYRKVTVADSGVTVGAMNVNGDYNFSGGTITAGAVSVADDKTLGLTAGSTPALSAATVTFNTSGKLNITGYTPDESSPYNSASKNTLTVISTSGGVSGFAPANVTVAGQTSVDFLTARAYRDGNDIKVDTTLSWFLNDSTAHGTFTIAEGESFTLSAALADEAGNVNWNGQTLTKKGGGTLVLTGANTYSGGTTVSEGLINFNSPGNFSTGNVTLDGGGLQWASGNTADISDRLNAIGTGGATFDTNGQDVIFATGLSGGGVIKDGAGTLTLAGTNSYTGMTTVRSGTLALGAGGSLASTDLTLHAGTVFDATAGTHSLDNGSLTVWGEGATYQGNLSARGATLNFIASGPVAGSMLGVTGTADVDGSNVNVGVFGGHTFATGDTLSLLKAAGGLTGTVTQGDGSGILKVGATVVHNLSLTATTDEITATVTAGSATEQAKALSEGYLGGVILALQGADLIAGRGMDSARQAAGTASRTGGGYGMAGFGAVSGGMLRYNTGSHVDMHSISLLTGLSWGANTRAGDLTVSAFFEFGNGSYDTHNSFAGAASVDGDGSTHYLGGGVLGRMDFTDTGPGHIYAEVSARAGKVHNDYDSSDLRDANGRTADYESSAPYYGLHLGAGYVWNINEKASLDVYGKYFWTRQEGDSTSLSTGESLRFKDVDSHRLRTGARFAYEVNEYISPYIGAAWEHEFDGKAKATTNGNRIDAPDMKGSTGIGELGLTVKPSQNLPLTFDLGVQGYTGKREGVTGSLQFRWEF